MGRCPGAPFGAVVLCLVPWCRGWCPSAPLGAAVSRSVPRSRVASLRRVYAETEKTSLRDLILGSINTVVRKNPLWLRDLILGSINGSVEKLSKQCFMMPLLLFFCVFVVAACFAFFGYFVSDLFAAVCCCVFDAFVDNCLLCFC